MDLLHGPIASPRTGAHMRANRFNGYTDYGVGIGLRVPHYDHIEGIACWRLCSRGGDASFSESLLQMIHPHHPQLSPLGDEATCRLVAPAGALMENGAQPQTFVEMVLALLENRYPWLGEDEPVRARKPWTN
jgi:hypothetical protein